ncbi:MAG: hypothetical protein E6J34_20135, partial [Chloroflexi bacterium]
MARVQRTDITVTVEEWLSKRFWGQMVLWLGDHIKDPHFITSFTLWAVKAAARVLEPLLLFCAAYLMVSIGIKSLMQPGLHDFSLSVLTGAPDIILPGGFVTVWQKFAKKEYVGASLLTLLLAVMAVLTGFANADVFKVIKLEESQITQLLFWRAMIGMAYSTTVIITLLTKHQAHEETVHLPTVHARIDSLHAEITEQQRTFAEQMTERANTISLQLAQVTEHLNEQFRSLGMVVTEQLQSVTEQIADPFAEQTNRMEVTENEGLPNETEQQMMTCLAPILQTLEQYVQVLAVLPEMHSTLGQIEQSTQRHVYTMVEEVTSLKTTVLEQSRALPKLLERVVTVQPLHHAEVPLSNIRQLPRTNRSEMGPNTETNILDKGSFVRQCLTENPNIRNSEI